MEEHLEELWEGHISIEGFFLMFGIVWNISFGVVGESYRILKTQSVPQSLNCA